MGIRLIVLLTLSMTLTGCWPFDSDDSSSPNTVTYTAEFSEPSPPNLYPCDGEVVLPKVLNVCKNNSGQIVDNTNCSNIPIPKVVFKSPAGEQIDPLVNDYIEIIGDRTFTCEEGKNRAQSEVIVSCPDERYKLKCESNQRESFCKHFPVRMQISTELTCIEFSDQTYKCSGIGLNTILRNTSPRWNSNEYNYLRELPYFKGYKGLTFNIGGAYAVAIKDNKTIGRVNIGSGLSEGNTGLDAIEIKTGDYGNSNGNFTCYIGIDRKLYCKGNGDSFGYATGASVLYYQIPNLENLNKLYVSNNTCVQELDGTVYCAGNYRPALGLGDEEPEEYWVPFLEVPGFFNAKELHLNQYNTCSITQDNKLVCAGSGFAASSTPREIDEFEGLTSFTLGYNNTCGVINSKLYCFEYFNDDSSFREIESFSGIKQVFSSKNFSDANLPEIYSESTLCGIMENNDVKCVGTNEDYELGVGDNNPRMEPVVIWEF